ncbi:hypothetical protein MTR67_007710 [Solanum verrucosum]|uniref:Uncharacterized protein n=1 Tax=Solanum verrucosum TaxID=315347 RepID=A0AAF0Q3V1_SOLVR|nr:hypothetical protein MTR67_007710 [Solanum verrucosum]
MYATRGPQKRLSWVEENSILLSEKQLQKLRLSFQLTTPLGHDFKPRQPFVDVETSIILCGWYRCHNETIGGYDEK